MKIRIASGRLLRFRILLLLLQFLPLAAVQAQISGNDGYFAYHDNGNGTCALLLYSGPGGVVNIPNTLSNLFVKSIGDDAFFDCYNLTSVTIPDGVENMGQEVFYNCTNLTAVTMPDSITNIGNSSFWSCYKLANITIPDEVENLAANVFAGCAGLTNVTIPDSVTNIGPYAFQQCAGLASVTIPESVISIENDAFTGCGLNEITIGASVTTIGESAFQGCLKLTNVTISASVTDIEDLAFAASRLTSVTIPDTVQYLGEYAFDNCESLTSVTIGAGIAELGEGMFDECINLTNVTLTTDPDMDAIDDNAFVDCSSLTSITLPDGLDIIGSSAFTRCTHLTNVTFGEGLEYIEDYAFSECTQLTDVELPDSLFEIGNYAFSQSGVGSIIIPDGVEDLGAGVFYYCLNLTNVAIGENVTNIDDYSFYNCYFLSDVTIGDAVRRIGNYAFWGCENLPSVYVPDYVTNIGNYAFEECGSLTNVSLPDGLTDIGDGAFAFCPRLTELDIPDNVSQMGNDVYEGDDSLTSVTIPASITDIGDADFSSCTRLTGINVDTNNPDYTSVNGVLFNKSMTVLIEYPAAKAGSYVIPGSVTNIADYAFWYCDGLTSITIPSSVTSIGDYAFEYCAPLTNIAIPASVTSIGASAFASGYYLAAITVDTNNPAYSSVNGVLFDKSQTTLIQYPSAKSGGYVIPGSVTSIGYDAFDNANEMPSVMVPASVTNIANYAFDYCQGMTGIYFFGNAPSLGGPNVFYADSATVYYLAGATGWGTTFDGLPTATWINGGGGNNLGTALNATNLTWTTSGYSDWFVETTNTHDGVAAAQSGTINGSSPSSVLQTTVTGPGSLTFWWSTLALGPFFELELAIDGQFYGDLPNTQPWTQEPAINIPSGTHTLTWTAFGSAGIGWVDQVQYTTNSVSNSPVSVQLSLTIERYQDFIYGGTYYYVYPYISSISPVPVTTNSVVSPDGMISTQVPKGASSSGIQYSGSYSSLAQAISACTNGLWTLYINKGDPSQQTFHFGLAINSLTTNLLSPVNILSPAPNAINVASNSPFIWAGPSNASSVYIEAYQENPSYVTEGYTNLGGAATNWPSSPALLTGTNYVFLEYGFYNFTNYAFSTPVDSGSNPIASWYASMYLDSEAEAIFTVKNPLAVQLAPTPPQTGGGNFQLSFQTIPGHTEIVQMRTNLTSGTWTTVTNFTGDGSTFQLSTPITNSPGKYYRVITQ